jgi:hypothetical protein
VSKPLDICLSGVWPFLNTLGLLILAWLHRRNAKALSDHASSSSE